MSSLKLSKHAQDHYDLADPSKGTRAILACKIKEMKHVALMHSRSTVFRTFYDIESILFFTLHTIPMLLNV